MHPNITKLIGIIDDLTEEDGLYTDLKEAADAIRDLDDVTHLLPQLATLKEVYDGITKEADESEQSIVPLMVDDPDFIHALYAFLSQDMPTPLPGWANPVDAELMYYVSEIVADLYNEGDPQDDTRFGGDDREAMRIATLCVQVFQEMHPGTRRYWTGKTDKVNFDLQLARFLKRVRENLSGHDLTHIHDLKAMKKILYPYAKKVKLDDTVITLNMRQRDRITKFIRNVMQNYPEYSWCLYCVKCNYDACEYTFYFDEDDEYFKVHLEMLNKGFAILAQQVINGKLPGLNLDMGPLLSNNDDIWSDWEGDWDAPAVDAMVQCAIFGDVILG